MSGAAFELGLICTDFFKIILRSVDFFLGPTWRMLLIILYLYGFLYVPGMQEKQNHWFTHSAVQTMDSGDPFF